MSAEQQIEQLKEHIQSLEEKFQQLKDQLDKATSKRKEDFYQRHLEKLLNGRHSKNNHGFSDVENEESIHEIKGWKDYKMVVGQLKAYSFKQAKRKRLVAAFYGDASEQYKQKAVEFINSEQINVIELIDLPDGGISIKKLGVEINNENVNDPVQLFIVEHLEEKKGAHVKVREVITRYNPSLKTHHQKTVKQIFEKYLGPIIGKNQSRSRWDNWCWKQVQ